MDRAIKRYLFEQDDEELDQADDKSKDGQTGDTASEKDQELKNKDLGDVDKDDLEDDDIEEGDVAISVTLNDNLKGGGKIKLVSFRQLPSLTTVEALLRLFDIDPEKTPPSFKDMLEITIRSPLADFVNQTYEIRLMDGYGELSINRPDFNKTISKTAPGANMQQAVQAQTSPEGSEQPAQPEQQQQINLGYLSALNYEFRQSVKNEFFNRILAKQ